MRPVRLEITHLVSSRYDSGGGSQSKGARPADWDTRKEGVDVVLVSSGATVKLKSSAMQSPPKPGWVIMLNGGSETEGYTWTLYGISHSPALN